MKNTSMACNNKRNNLISRSQSVLHESLTNIGSSVKVYAFVNCKYETSLHRSIASSTAKREMKRGIFRKLLNTLFFLNWKDMQFDYFPTSCIWTRLYIYLADSGSTPIYSTFWVSIWSTGTMLVIRLCRHKRWEQKTLPNTYQVSISSH